MKLIEEFKYTGFEGPIRMKQPDQEYCIFEHWELDASSECNVPAPKAVYLGRFIGSSQRDVVAKYDLKKRRYISTTSMDAELALVTANISLASSGKLFYDPFTGTGSFLVAAAHLGATVWGSDIDGRSIRGKGKVGLLSNFVQYGLTGRFGDSFAADLTNTPLRAARLFDGIICDPPYGVREGLKVLGSKDPSKPKEPVIIDGIARHTYVNPRFRSCIALIRYRQDDYIPPKKPYGFLAMLDDILDFAALSIVDNGRLSFWMPTSNDKEEEIQVPTHPYLEITSVCTQSFNKCKACGRFMSILVNSDRVSKTDHLQAES
jgi:tRNA (guanine10-N2)-methyltransferase